MKQPLRIVQVCPYDWHAPGGVQEHVRNLSSALVARGHNVLILAPGQRPATESETRIIGRPIRVPFNGTVAPICPSPLAGLRLRRCLREFRPDIVHVHEPIAPSLGAYAGLVSTVPVVGTFHAHCVTPFGRFCYAVATGPFNRHLAAGIAVSNAATDWLHPGVTVPFRIIPNGVDDIFFGITRRAASPAGARILFAHRLEPRKGFDVALAAFSHLAARDRTWELIVVGDGPTRHLVGQVPAAVRARVRLLGTLSRSALVAEFAAASVFIAPAHRGESFGMAILEAMAAGLPVVASAVGGYKETVRPGVDGLLVPPGDDVALAHAVATVLESPVTATRLGSAGRRRAAEFRWDRITGEIERCYEETCDRRLAPLSASA